MKPRVYKATLRNETKWCLDRIEDGKRKRSFFGTKTEAEAALSHVKDLAKEDRCAFLELPPTDRESLMRACVRAMENGHDVAAIVALLNGTPPAAPVTCQRALDLYLDHLRAGGRSEKYLRNVKGPITALIGTHGREPLSVITRDMLLAWLEGRTGWTRASYRARARYWFEFARLEKWLPENPTDRILSVRIVAKEPEVLSVDDHEKVLRFLETHRPRGLAWYVLSSMCGLRPGEAEKITWARIKLETARPVANVGAITSKMREGRPVFLSEQAVAWLKHARELGADLPLPYQPRRRVLDQVKKHLGRKKWTQSMTRHMAASYRMALEQNAPAVAEGLGHSVQTMKRHYQAVVTYEDAVRFFSIMPAPATANTVQVNFRKPARGRHAPAGDVTQAPETVTA